MTTRFGIATFAAATSAVLIFGNTAHAEGQTFVGDPLKLATISKTPTITSVPQPSSELTNPTSMQTPPPLMPAPKFDEKLQKLQPIAAETKAPIIIQHPVTDASNSYAWGQCTWYAKNKRPDLPNNLGNANTWYSTAAAEGYSVGSTPYAGAIGTTTEGAYGHVVYVESVNTDGTVNISEMNYAGGVGVVHYRTVAASEFSYIY
jgi:surface antigen